MDVAYPMHLVAWFTFVPQDFCRFSVSDKAARRPVLHTSEAAPGELAQHVREAMGTISRIIVASVDRFITAIDHAP